MKATHLSLRFGKNKILKPDIKMFDNIYLFISNCMWSCMWGKEKWSTIQ